MSSVQDESTRGTLNISQRDAQSPDSFDVLVTNAMGELVYHESCTVHMRSRRCKLPGEARSTLKNYVTSAA